MKNRENRKKIGKNRKKLRLVNIVKIVSFHMESLKNSVKIVIHFMLKK